MRDFQRIQYGFTARLRDPDTHAVPAGVEPRRMAVYERLIYANVDQFLSNAFPVLKKLLSTSGWQQEVRGFLRQHRASSPFFQDISAAYVDWLESRPVEQLPLPFAAELAHYEWAELALAISDEVPDWPHIDPQACLADSAPVVSPTVWCLRYRYPVHRIGPGFQPSAPDADTVHLIVLRDQADRVRFMRSNALTHVMLETFRRARLPARDVLQGLAEMLNEGSADALVQSGLATLEHLRDNDVILGGWEV